MTTHQCTRLSKYQRQDQLLAVGVIVASGIAGALPFGQGIGRLHQFLLVALSISTRVLLFLAMRL